MTDSGDRLARVLHDAVPEPPHELEPSAIRAKANVRPREGRKRLLVPALAAVAVAVVAIGVPVAVHQLATHRLSAPSTSFPPPPVPPPPAGFTASEFRMAPSGVEVVGGAAIARATCTPQQISATAATRRAYGGVLGVIHLVGAVVNHQGGAAQRCTLPIARGPSALTGPDGRRLNVPLSGGDRTSPPGNPRPDLDLSNGKAIWGFAWLGSYCGAPARAIEIPLRHAGQPLLRIPLHGPQPRCKPAIGTSALIDGVAGAPGEPVQPPRPDYSSLRLSGQIKPGTTSGRLARIDLTLRTIGGTPIILDPCPAYAGRDYATANSGGFSSPARSGYLPCTSHEAVIRPGHPLHWTVPSTSLLQAAGTGATPGSTVYIRLGIAGVPSLLLKTTAH